MYEGTPEEFKIPADSECPIAPESKESLPPRIFSFYNNGKLIDSFLGDTTENAVREFETRNNRKFGLDEGDSFNTENTKDVIFTE